jgi:multiple sugar transport system substrate-binding protein
MATVQMDFSFGPEDTGTVQSLVDEFNQQHPGIRVKYREMPADTDRYHDRLRRMFDSGASGRIDVIGGDVIWPAEFASKGWIADLSGRFPQLEQDKFRDAPIEANTYQGKVWGVPWYTDVGLLYYRSDLLEQSGFSGPPQTWDELKQMAQKVKQDSGIQHGYVFQGAQYEGGVCNGLEFIWTHGGDVLDSNGRVIINSNEAKQGLRTERRIVEDGVAPQDVVTYTEEPATVRFLDEGDAVFCRFWDFMYGFLGEPDLPLSRDQVGVAELPREQGVQQGGACLGGSNMFINADSTHQNEAWEFIEFMTAREQQRRLAIGTSRLPTRKELYQDQQLLNQVPILNLSSRALNNARPRPINPCYLDMSGEMAEQFNLSLKGVVTPDQVAQTLQTELSNIVANC